MGIGFRELLVILVIALVVFGAKRLKSIGSDLGHAVRGFKEAMNEGEEEERHQLSCDDAVSSETSRSSKNGSSSSNV